MDDLFESFPVITTKRLQLVQITKQHRDDIYNIFSNADLMKNYNMERLEQIEEADDIVNWFSTKYADKKGIRWGICLHNSTTLIGTIGINSFIYGHKGTIGYELHPQWWKQGYASEALEAILPYLFNGLGLDRIEAEVRPENSPSGAILVRCGFKLEGTLRHWLYRNGQRYDMQMYSMLRSDWKSKLDN